MCLGLWAQRAVATSEAFRRRARQTVIVGTTISGLLYVYAFDPSGAGHYPRCPFVMLTGLYCPGCGSLRALHHLTHGDLAGAVRLNVLLVFIIAWLVLHQAVARVPALGSIQPAVLKLTVTLTRFAPGVIVLFWVLRNLPGPFQVLAP